MKERDLIKRIYTWLNTPVVQTSFAIAYIHNIRPDKKFAEKAEKLWKEVEEYLGDDVVKQIQKDIDEKKDDVEF